MSSDVLNCGLKKREGEKIVRNQRKESMRYRSAERRLVALGEGLNWQLH